MVEQKPKPQILRSDNLKSVRTTSHSFLYIPKYSFILLIIKILIKILKKDENRLTFMIAHIEKDLAGLSNSDLENIARHSNLYKSISQ